MLPVWLCMFTFAVSINNKCKVKALTTEVSTLGNGYIGVNLEKTWVEAENYCQNNFGTSLARIGSDRQNTAVRDAASYAGIGNESQLWIGYNDRDIENTFEWEGWDFYTDYTRWYPGEPNDAYYNEDCAELLSSIYAVHNGTWNDNDCDLTHKFVCNYYDDILLNNGNEPFIAIGPYVDSLDRNLRYGPHDYGYNNITCYLACTSDYAVKYEYFALQNRGWCCCDNNFTHATRDGETACGYYGGGFCNFIYQVMEPS